MTFNDVKLLVRMLHKVFMSLHAITKGIHSPRKEVNELLASSNKLVVVGIDGGDVHAERGGDSEGHSHVASFRFPSSYPSQGEVDLEMENQ